MTREERINQVKAILNRSILPGRVVDTLAREIVDTLDGLPQVAFHSLERTMDRHGYWRWVCSGCAWWTPGEQPRGVAEPSWSVSHTTGER